MNIAQALKAEISRISKKEAKLLSSPTRSTTIQLKKAVADLKNRLKAIMAVRGIGKGEARKRLSL